MPTPTLKDVVSALEVPLAKLGFRHRGSGEFTLDVNDDVVGYFSVRRTKWRDIFSCQPDVGVRHEPLTRFVRELVDDDAAPRYAPVSIRSHLGWLMPKKRRYKAYPNGLWELADVRDLRRLEVMVAVLKKFGLPYIAAHDNLEAIVDALIENRSLEPRTVEDWGYEAPAGLCLLGRFDEALEHLLGELETWRGDPSAWANNYRAFARQLIARMQSSGWRMPPEGAASLESLLVVLPEPPPPTAAELAWPLDNKSRRRPLIEQIDELLAPRGFHRFGSVWRKDAANTVLVLELESVSGFGIYDVPVGAWLKAFGRPQMERVRFGSGYLHIGYGADEICPEPVSYRLNRALNLTKDIETSGIEHSDRYTEAEKQAIIRAMEPDVPLTMDWRLKVLREFIEGYALPLLEKIESSRLTRLRLAFWQHFFWYL